MKKQFTTTQLLSVGVTLLSLLGMYLNNQLHEKEIAELKADIIAEVREGQRKLNE